MAKGADESHTSQEPRRLRHPRFRQLMLVNNAAVLADLRVAHLVMDLLDARLPEFPAIAPACPPLELK